VAASLIVLALTAGVDSHAGGAQAMLANSSATDFKRSVAATIITHHDFPGVRGST
jgi:hypothetical protein